VNRRAVVTPFEHIDSITCCAYRRRDPTAINTPRYFLCKIVRSMFQTFGGAYNIDLLWSLIASNLDKARLVKISRIHSVAAGFSVPAFLSQMGAGGRWLAKAIGQTRS